MKTIKKGPIHFKNISTLPENEIDETSIREKFHRLSESIAELQEKLYAEHKNRLLVIFQGMDTSGKDSTTKNVFSRANPAGVRMVGFKAPTELEKDYDYLWRVHTKIPAKGEIVIFNRSHYEDIVTVAALDIYPKKVWQKRIEHVVNFEKILIDEGVTIVKFFLHVSRVEQKKRLLERLKNPEKNWKWDEKDIDARKHFQKFQKMYEYVLPRTSHQAAPWHIIPADVKWYRNYLVAKEIEKILLKIDPKFPKLNLNVNSMIKKLK